MAVVGGGSGVCFFLAGSPNSKGRCALSLLMSITMDGAGGARFSVQDSYSAETFFSSDYLKNAEVWKQVAGSFTSGPNTKLVVVRVERVPAGSPMRGNLWIDGVRLVPSQPGSSK